MKKHFLKSFALLAMLFSALTMSAKQYCGESMTSNVGWNGNYVLSAEKVSDTQSRLTISVTEGEQITGFYQLIIQNQGGGTASKSLFDPNDADFNNPDLFSVSADGKSAVININWTTYPTSDIQVHMILRRNNSAGGSDIFGNTITDLNLLTACGGSGEIYDVNFATSNGSSAEATSGNATAAIDNNAGTRWESAQEDPQTWTLDLGQLRIFNTLEIVWEGAYGKTFTVSVSDDKETWKPIWTVEGQELAGFPYTQTQKIDKTTGRYIQFHGTARGTGYGYSFYEFRVYLAGESTFTTLEAKPATNLSKVGEGNAITLTAKDQNGQLIATPDGVTYTITPADAGTITNNIYTPAKIGSASIVATIGEVSAPAFDVFAYDGENVALSPDINNSKIIAQSDFAPSGTDAWHAIDGNEGSVWQGSATNGGAGDEAARTYDSWFVVDFGGYYDINLVSIKFEGACSQEYHVDFSADNATWNQAYNYVGSAGINGHTKLIYGNDLQNNTKVRYARFYSTKAATQWGVKMFEFKVYGTTWEAPTDTEKPVMGTVSLKSKTYNSAVISVDATDNMGIKAYRVRHGSTFDQTFIPNANGEITLTDLETGDYSLTITAKDLSDNESENSATLEFTIEELIYCNFPTGHESNAAFGDVNGRILVSAIKVTPKNIRLIIKSAEESTKNIDLVYVAPTDAAAVTVGSDVTEGGSREVAVDIEYTTAPATYGYMIQWSNPAWDGRWQASINNISPTQLCTELVEIEDINFALAENGSSATASEGNAGEAIDDNMGTRWGTGASDPHWWVVDLGQLRIFNAIQIVWEDAYGKTFTIETSSDNSDWDLAATITDQELAGFPYTQTINIDKTTARYVRFNGTARGTGHGYSFYEFRVYLAGESTFTSLEAKPANGLAKVGESLAINVTAKDQNGQVMTDAGEVTYTITPADAGTITNGLYTPAKIGVASIVATIGEVSAPAFEVFAYDGENVALSPDNNNSKIVAQSEFAPSGTDAWHAIDGNEGSVWQGSATNGTAGDEAARTFDSWFVVDFGAYYDINLVSIKFEGACAQDYHIDFSADNATWNVAYNHVGNNGINAHTKYIYGSDLQNTTKVRYARFYSTKAATQWGVKVFEFQVYGLPFVASGDTEKPEMGTATLVSKNHNSAIITVTATDNDEVASYHIVDNANSYEQTLAPTDGKITLVGLNPETAYTFTITALDLAGNESENAATVSFTTDVYNLKPTAAPAAPTHDATKVQSVFCDVYGGTFSAKEDWGQTTQFEELNFEGNHVRYYTNFNYLGWQTATPINAFAMEKLHLDIWVTDNTTLDIVPIYGGTGLTTDDGQRKKVTLTGQQWNSIDLILTTDYPNLNLNSIFQFKFDNPTGANIFAFDNVYFYRESEIGDETPPTNLTATAVPAFETAVISCQATDESSISYKVYLGAELKGTGSANSGETVAITVTNLQPNREFTMTVIATDVYGNESAETVDVTFTTLSYPAPAPTPIWNDKNVKSIYSESYAPAFKSLNSYNEGWWNAPQMLDAAIAPDNHALYYYGFTDGMIGWQFAAFDATGYTTFTMDIYPMNDGTIDFGPLNEDPANDYAITGIPVKGGQWNTITVDLRDKDLTKIFQVKMINYYSLGAFFIDNVYLYKEVHQKVTGSLEITEDYAYTSLTITEDGKVTISNGAKLIVKDFVIQSTMGAGNSGQLVGATLSNFDVIGDAYIDITLGNNATADQWHAFTVPFPVNALNGIYETDGTKLHNEVDYAIMDYHGDIRANGKYGWKKYRGDLVPGTFYIMTVNGNINTFRFKKTDGSSVVAANNKALVAYDGSGTDTDKGWNGVGNPTLAYGSVAHAVQVLNPETYTYVIHEANATNFTVGTPFFIQAASNDNMTMAVADASKPSYAPARQQTTEVKAKVYLSNENYTDRLYIHATNDATTTYEIGKDLVKMTMTNTPSVPQLFARAYNTDLCMIHTPLSNDEAVVALNLYAPADGEYTLSAEAQNGETIYLLKDNAIVWDLTASEYTIYLSQGNTEVYGVAIKRAPQVETGVNDGATIQTLPSKVILQGNLYILHNGQVYDAMGKCVK